MKFQSVLLFSLSYWQGSGFIIIPHKRCCSPQLSKSFQLFSSTKDKQNPSKEDSILDLEEPAGIVGAEFFGGNKEKEEFYDPVAEANAGEELNVAATSYERFQDSAAFETPRVAQIAQALQNQLNAVLYETSQKQDDEGDTKLQYARNLVWDSCFDAKSSTDPLSALKQAMEFYRRLDVAIISGKQLDDGRFQLHWEVSVEWPIFWEPRAVVTGYSDLTLNDDNIISKQVDSLDSSSDLVSTVGPQLQPRFWDMFHIGMSPSAEIMPRVEQGGGFLPRSYNLFDVPAKLVTVATQLDSEAGREDGNAQMVPNHAFSCVIKTMGPQKQRFVPASPTQVQILPTSQGSPPMLKWSVPLSVEFQTQFELPIPGDDPEARPNSNPECRYEFQPRRRVATLPYGGTPQDVEIVDVRKKLYDLVTKDGLKPKVDADGRPQFFFLLNCVKACYTEEGLGMCVYEWRPEFVKPNEVGIELEMSQNKDSRSP